MPKISWWTGGRMKRSCSLDTGRGGTPVDLGELRASELPHLQKQSSPLSSPAAGIILGVAHSQGAPAPILHGRQASEKLPTWQTLVSSKETR